MIRFLPEWCLLLLTLQCLEPHQSLFGPSQTVVQLQLIKINLQEESCLIITSFVAEGIMVNPGDVLPNTSVNALYYGLKEIDLTIPVDVAKLDQDICKIVDNCFTGARLHVERLIFIQSSYLSFELLNLEKDPTCFSLWKGQPIDSSQRKWFLRATHLGLSLETGSLDDLAQSKTQACGIVLNCINLA
jgi:hypothetical protein